VANEQGGKAWSAGRDRGKEGRGVPPAPAGGRRVRLSLLEEGGEGRRGGGGEKWRRDRSDMVANLLQGASPPVGAAGRRGKKGEEKERRVFADYSDDDRGEKQASRGKKKKKGREKSPAFPPLIGKRERRGALRFPPGRGKEEGRGRDEEHCGGLHCLCLLDRARKTSAKEACRPLPRKRGKGKKKGKKLSGEDLSLPGRSTTEDGKTPLDLNEGREKKKEGKEPAAAAPIVVTRDGKKRSSSLEGGPQGREGKKKERKKREGDSAEPRSAVFRL